MAGGLPARLSNRSQAFFQSWSRLLQIAAVAAFGVYSVSCVGTSNVTNIPGDSMAPQSSGGSLSEGDVIKVIYPGAPELNLTQRIQSNGKVSLPIIGDITAAGKSLSSFQTQLASLYTPHLQDPKVQVVIEAAAAAVYVSGEVLRPGKVPLDRTMTALEAIMEAGGFSKFANPKKVFIVRNEHGKQQRYVLNLSDTLSGTSNQAFYVKAYDVIYVKQSNW